MNLHSGSFHRLCTHLFVLGFQYFGHMLLHLFSLTLYKWLGLLFPKTLWCCCLFMQSCVSIFFIFYACDIKFPFIFLLIQSCSLSIDLAWLLNVSCSVAMILVNNARNILHLDQSHQWSLLYSPERNPQNPSPCSGLLLMAGV